MAVVKFTKFGGLAPSVDPRNLPLEGAQIAQNLDLRFGDFRPSKGLGSSVASVPAGSRSIFRTPSGVWLSSTTDTNYVNGQVPDAASERVYLTGRSAYPEAWQGGVYRRLGVPAPTSAPTVTLVANSQFDQTAATAAQQQAATAVVNAVLATDSQAYFGAAVPASAASPGAFDLLYPKVELHVSFDTLTAGQFVDLSPQQRLLTKGGGVSQVTDTAGPLGASGSNYGLSNSASAGGISFREIRRWRDEVDPTWCVEFHVTAAVTYDYLSIQSRDYNLRELGGRGTSGWGSLVSSNYTGRTNEDLLCRRTDGSAALPAGVSVHVALQCTGTSVLCYIDGTLCGTVPYALGLEMSNFCKSQYGSGDFRGKFDELRVTLATRYSGTGFTKPTAPFATAALPTGLTLAHGATASLPTDSGRDAAYLVQLAAAGGGFAAVNSADEYLRLPPFTGTQLTYIGNTYWAVAVKGWRADGLTTTQSAISTALAAVDNPASPGTPLLTAGKVATLAPLLYAAYDTSSGVLSSMVSAINTAQAELRAELARTTPVAATVAAKLAALTAASDALTAYFADIATKLRTILAANESTLFGAITSAVVNREETTRAYIVTYVTDWDEESAPSAPSELLTVDQNDGVAVVIPAPPSGRNIVGWRLYRSTSTSTGAIWSLVADEKASNAIVRNGTFISFNISARSYTDTVPDEKLQEPCETITWAEPPANLQGLVGLPNGIMAGFFGSTICFSEPYAPYAWPVEYQQTLENPIVAIGVFGQTAVVLTTGFPYYASGADSASMSCQKIEVPQSCVAARSVASVDGGVIYASPDGLCLASPSGIDVITQGAFNKADWQAAVTSGAVGAFHDGAYYLFTG